MGAVNLIQIGTCLIFLGQLMVPSLCEVYTAMVHMEGLLKLEVELLTSLNSYITAETERLQQLEDFSSRVTHAHSLYRGKPLSTHLHDPINAFQLVNRYSNVWMKLHENIYANNSNDLMANISLNNYRLPTDEDFPGAILALQRLQKTYLLSTSSLASGMLSDIPSLTLSAKDCYLIGREFYRARKWTIAGEWMKEALDKFDKKGSDSGYSDIDISLVYDCLSFLEYKLDNLKEAAQYTRDLLQYDPDNERALANLDFFEGSSTDKPVELVDENIEADTPDDKVKNFGTLEMELYEATCRKGKSTPSSLHHKLVCYYFDNNRNPRLMLQPVKVEVVHPDPEVIVFRDLLSDVKMERLKELATPKFKRARVKSITGESKIANSRIGKIGWLYPQDDALGYVARIDQRLEDVTGLTVTTAEPLQVLNYGIAGQYQPHFDFNPGNVAHITEETGKRISTVTFYMSDVELGGATVFPFIGLRISPVKGDAAFWWNLKEDGSRNYLSRHAGCPVLVGSKWVCTKWFHEHGQEFRRPCSLSPDE